MGKTHRIYLIPGMFGFGRLAGYDYFEHVVRGLGEEFHRDDIDHHIEVVSLLPTASIKRRARAVAEHVHGTAEPGDVIHLVGHSTGGIDARLLASPSLDLGVPAEVLAWRRQIASIVSINTPHYGTPLAQFFATVSGTRLLYALSLLTVTTLSLGGPPLTILSNLVAAIGGIDQKLGLKVQLLDRTTDLLLRFVGERGRDEVHTWLDGIQHDQGGIIQIIPESMDLFNATTENAKNVRYGCIVTCAPPPRPVRFLGAMRSPYSAFTATIYSTVWAITARAHKRYPYPEPDGATLAHLNEQTGQEIGERSNDGIVPTLSMLWGELLFASAGDHLDIVGHFHDDAKRSPHTDWLYSGSGFDRHRFHTAMKAIADFMLDRG